MTYCFVMQLFSFSNYFGFMTSCLCHAAQFFAQISFGFMISHLCHAGQVLAQMFLIPWHLAYAMPLNFLLKLCWLHDRLLMWCSSISFSNFFDSITSCLCHASCMHVFVFSPACFLRAWLFSPDNNCPYLFYAWLSELTLIIPSLIYISYHWIFFSHVKIISLFFFFKFKLLESLVSICYLHILRLTSLINTQAMSSDSKDYSNPSLCEYPIENNDYQPIGNNKPAPVMNFALASFFSFFHFYWPWLEHWWSG